MKNYIITGVVCLILGGVIALSSIFIYQVIKLQGQVAKNTVAISQIVDFLNKANATAK